MYLIGSFIIALAITAGALIKREDQQPVTLGRKTETELVHDNSMLKIMILFLVSVILTLMFVKIKND